MDRWLTSPLKALLHRPCVTTASLIGARLENRIETGQEISETTLTDEFVDSFRPQSRFSMWKPVADAIRDEFRFYLNVDVNKSTIEPRTGADIGLVIRRSVYAEVQSTAEYAVLIQCKKVDQGGGVEDFFHTVGGSGERQSALMLSITPASFYFLYVPPSLLSGYADQETMAFVIPANNCHVPIWNLGAMPSESIEGRHLTLDEIAAGGSILVIPALAVEAQKNQSKAAKLNDILPNAFPFWYWFSEMLIPGFVGDQSRRVIEVAQNTRRRDLEREGLDFGVRYSITVGLGSG